MEFRAEFSSIEGTLTNHALTLRFAEVAARAKRKKRGARLAKFLVRCTSCRIRD